MPPHTRTTALAVGLCLLQAASSFTPSSLPPSHALRRSASASNRPFETLSAPLPTLGSRGAALATAAAGMPSTSSPPSTGASAGRTARSPKDTSPPACPSDAPSVVVFTGFGDLRVHDNAGLFAASSGKEVRAVFVFDPDYLASLPNRRISLLHSAVSDLGAKLSAIGVTLDVLKGPLTPTLASYLAPTPSAHVYLHDDPSAPSLLASSAVSAALPASSRASLPLASSRAGAGRGDVRMMLGAAPFGSKDDMKEMVDRAITGDGFKKKITLLGSTGSIGTQTLDIVDYLPDTFEVVGLAAGSNVDLLSEQIKKFSPKIVSVKDDDTLGKLKDSLKGWKGDMPELVCGAEGINDVAEYGDADCVVTGIVGCAGLLPTVKAIEAGKDIALANKETLISGGPAILPLLRKHNVKMTPADSEHSAIFQSLQGVPPDSLRRIILTASGGAFRDVPAEELLRLCKEDPEFVQKKATTHPNWDMGAKITVDSATLMNKGLEVIEAHYLFGATYDQIDVVIHPQSILHSAIETIDSSVIGQLGWPDMRLPLVYAMSWPHRLDMPYEPLDFAKMGTMTFMKPDRVKYPSLDLSFSAGRTGGTMTAALNAANEQANEMFRDGKIGFMDIFKVIEATMEAHKEDLSMTPSLDDIVKVDEWAREKTLEVSGDKKLILPV